MDQPCWQWNYHDQPWSICWFVQSETTVPEWEQTEKYCNRNIWFPSRAQSDNFTGQQFHNPESWCLHQPDQTTETEPQPHNRRQQQVGLQLPLLAEAWRTTWNHHFETGRVACEKGGNWTSLQCGDKGRVSPLNIFLFCCNIKADQTYFFLVAGLCHVSLFFAASQCKRELLCWQILFCQRNTLSLEMLQVCALSQEVSHLQPGPNTMHLIPPSLRWLTSVEPQVLSSLVKVMAPGPQSQSAQVWSFWCVGKWWHWNLACPVVTIKTIHLHETRSNIISHAAKGENTWSCQQRNRWRFCSNFCRFETFITCSLDNSSCDNNRSTWLCRCYWGWVWPVNQETRRRLWWVSHRIWSRHGFLQSHSLLWCGQWRIPSAASPCLVYICLLVFPFASDWTPVWIGIGIAGPLVLIIAAQVIVICRVKKRSVWRTEIAPRFINSNDSWIQMNVFWKTRVHQSKFSGQQKW